MESEQHPSRKIAGFESIVGHPTVVERLQRAISVERVHHAYLFTGPEGVGKASTAVALAQALNCNAAPGLGCDHCPACSRIARNIHPDLVLVEADGKQIKVQQIRQLEERLAQGAHEGNALVVLIDEVERMNISAANGLLRNLEEPRSGVHFVLVTSASHRVPITVRSRCQQVRFGPLDRDAVARLLVDRELSSAQIDEVARLSDGSLSRALLLLDNEAFPVWQQWVQRLATQATHPSDIPGQVQSLLSEVDDPEALLQLLLLRLRDHLLLAAGADEDGRRLVQVVSDSPEAGQARTLPLVLAERRLIAVQAGLRDLRFYVNKHLALEHLMLQLCRP